uniref:Uncharacterized protein n=1 Tax=Sinocyclocheilus rhinocerous TaxID=307959 RepID=A0A673FK55_9TELE
NLKVGQMRSFSGLFKLLLENELLTAVLAFGTCGGYTGKNVVSIFCGGGSNETLSATLTYPFRLGPITLRNC